MRSVFFWLLIVLLCGWTFLIFGSMFTVLEHNPAGSDAAKVGQGLGIMVSLFMWSVVAVPLGIFTLIAKPK